MQVDKHNGYKYEIDIAKSILVHFNILTLNNQTNQTTIKLLYLDLLNYY